MPPASHQRGAAIFSNENRFFVIVFLLLERGDNRRFATLLRIELRSFSERGKKSLAARKSITTCKLSGTSSLRYNLLGLATTLRFLHSPAEFGIPHIKGGNRHLIEMSRSLPPRRPPDA